MTNHPLDHEMAAALDEMLQAPTKASFDTSASEYARRVIAACADRLRLLPIDDGIVAIAQLLGWAKLSDAKVLPDNAMLPQFASTANMIDAIDHAEDFFRKSENDLWPVAFSGMSNRFRVIEPALGELIARLLSGLSTGDISYAAFAEALLNDDWNYRNRDLQFVIPNEVAQLVIELLEISEKESLYCPYLGSLRVALASASRIKRVSVELPHRDPFIASILVLADANIEVSFSDPILSPAFTDGRRLRLFDVAFAAGAFNFKRALPDFDFFGRFTTRMAFSDVVDSQHILSQTSRRAIAVVPNGFLTRNGISERQFREEIVMNGLLRAVVALPEGLLGSTSIPVNLLVFDKTDRKGSVLFIDARGPEFVEQRRERRASKNKLANSSTIVKIFHQHQNAENARVASSLECREQDFDLSVSRYLVSDELMLLHNALDKRQQTTLGDVTSMIVRGQSTPPGEDAIQMLFYEVGAADIDADGIVKAPKKELLVDEKDIRGAFTKQILHPGDIVMAVKGSVGTVGLVMQDAPFPDGWVVPMIRVDDGRDMTMAQGVIGTKMPTNWIVGQSYVLLRANDRIDPIVLFMYLRSRVAQSWIKSKATGTTVPNLQKQFIQGLPVMLPAIEEQARIKDRFHKIMQVVSDIDNLQTILQELLDEDWA